jgi:hypothetical protein
MPPHQKQKNSLVKNIFFSLVIFASGALSHYAYDTYRIFEQSKDLAASRKAAQMNFVRPDPLYATPELLNKLFSSGLRDDAMGCGDMDFGSHKEVLRSGRSPMLSFTARQLMMDPNGEECRKLKRKREEYDLEELAASKLQVAVTPK